MQHRTLKMSATNNGEEKPADLIEVGFCRSGVIWKWKCENGLELELIPNYDENGDLECTCGIDSAEGAPAEVKAESPVPRPMFVCGPGFTVEGPITLTPNEATLPLPVVKSEEVAPEGNVNLEEDPDQRILDYEAEGGVRHQLYSQWIMEAWVNVSAHSLHTDESEREAFRRRPHWGTVETVVNTAIALTWKGQGPPPKMLE